jgi:hypothetical protein
MREVVGPGGEGARNDDGGLDSPAVQLSGVADSIDRQMIAPTTEFLLTKDLIPV